MTPDRGDFSRAGAPQDPREAPGAAAPPNPHDPRASAGRLTTDALTGLPTASLFRAQFPLEFDLARERETNGALLAIRLDNIISINQLHGRSGGDEALRAVAYILGNVRAAPERSSHAVFTLGGPAFGYLIPSCSAPQARETAEQIHKMVMQSTLYPERLTVSIGIVNLYEFFMEEGTREEISLRIEQTAMYRLGVAERQGTNTICDTSDTSDAVVSPRPTVLVVDPDETAMELLVHSLEGAGFTVRVFQDGESALSFIQQTPPAAIISEVLTPRLSGFTVRERLRPNALWNAIPFILVSHKKTEEMIKKAVDRDIRHFFKKPLSITEVVGLIVNLTRKPAG